jgi:hypothetical protein
MIEITLGADQTLVVAIIAYFIGRWLINRIGFWTASASPKR